MMCQSRIVVEKGARLIIDGGKINSYNINSKWNGIEVAGAKSLNPVTPNQGYLEIKNGAVIENAYVGICNYEQGIWEGGGIIKASNCTFYNCRRGVALNDYPNYSYYVGPGNSNCSFDHVTFRIDNMNTLPTGSSYPFFFSSWNTSGGIRITNCTFTVDIPYTTLPVHKRGYGIYSLASGMLVRGCTFNGLMYGFSSAGYDGTPTRTVKLYSNNFEHNADNIMLAGDAFSDIGGQYNRGNASLARQPPCNRHIYRPVERRLYWLR